jgi:hypothetical protein
MGLVSNLAIIGGIACTAIYALTRLLALLIVLRGTSPEQRADLVRALAELFHRRSRHLGRTTPPGQEERRGPE